MKYIYSVDNFGRTTLEYKGNSRQKAKDIFANLYIAYLDQDTDRYIFATTKPIEIYNTPTLYEVKNGNI